MPRASRRTDSSTSSDRGGKRVQVFRLDGTYVSQVFIGRECKAPECGNGSTAASTAFSTDAGQRYLVRWQSKPGEGDGLRARGSELLDSFGEWGSAPGQFGTLHHMAADSKGNLYVTEVTPLRPENRRVQKFVPTPDPDRVHNRRERAPDASARRGGRARARGRGRRRRGGERGYRGHVRHRHAGHDRFHQRRPGATPRTGLHVEELPHGVARRASRQRRHGADAFEAGTVAGRALILRRPAACRG